MTPHLNPGDKCFVRIHTGEIVEAKYGSKNALKSKSHLVRFNGDIIIIHETKPKDVQRYSGHTFAVGRFVNMSHLEK